MKLLILGGTVFLGRHIVQDALARGFEVTLFNRGKSYPDLFPNVEQIHGDRDGGLEVLAGRSWDAVIDTCGYFPRIVRASAEFLSDATERYLFVSTISVYDDTGLDALDESSPVHTVDDPTVEVLGSNYGGLKALCEQACQEIYGDRALIVRPGLIVGPNDPTARFTYWPTRFHQGGTVLAPAPSDASVQFIDVRDLARWILDAVVSAQEGIFNATGPEQRLTFSDLVEACQHHAPAGTEVTWVDGDFLTTHEVAPYSELPLWLPPELASLHHVSINRAVAAGLRFRTLQETVADTLAWAHAQPDIPPPSDAEPHKRATPGLAPEREALLLKMWASPKDR